MADQGNTGTGIEEKIIIKVKDKTDFQFEKPKQYRVIMHNNDYTGLEAVVDVLEKVFNIGKGKARELMMHCHIHGFCQVFVATKEICELKTDQAHAYVESKAGTGTGGGRDGSASYEYMRFSTEEMPNT